MKIKYIIPILLVFLVINVGFSAQADNVEIYQSVPNPSILAANQEQTVYFVIYNTGNETINLNQITHDWGRDYLTGIESAYIGNDKIGYQEVDLTLELDNRPRKRYVNLDYELEIEPENFIEFYYTYNLSMAAGYRVLNTNFISIFEDNSSASRASVRNPFPINTIQKDFEIENDFYSTAKGANNTILPNETQNFSIRITNFGNEQYEDIIIIEFPKEFSNVHSENTNCILNMCFCYVNLTPNNFEICEINAKTPSEFGHYIIHASNLGFTSVSELLVRVMPPPVCPKPSIISTNISPREIDFGTSTQIEASVIGAPPVTNVWAEINGEIIILEGEGIPPYKNYSLEYFPENDGEYDVLIFAENICGIVNESAGILIVRPPVEPPGPIACKNISYIGLSKRPGVLDEQRLESLLNLNYYCAKNILGLWNYDVFIEITTLDGTYINVDGKNFFYGRAPGRTEILYGIEGESIKSPYYSVIQDPTRLDHPLQGRTSRMMRFNRMVLVETDSGYELVRLTLGVWN